MTLDTVISGCVTYYLESEDGLDPQRIDILENCLGISTGSCPSWSMMPVNILNAYGRSLRYFWKPIIVNSLRHPRRKPIHGTQGSQTYEIAVTSRYLAKQIKSILW